MGSAQRHDSLVGSGVNAVVVSLLLGLAIAVGFVPLSIALLPDTIAIGVLVVVGIATGVAFATYDEGLVYGVLAVLPLSYFGKIYTVAGLGCRGSLCEPALDTPVRIVVSLAVAALLGGLGYALGTYGPEYVEERGAEKS